MFAINFAFIFISLCFGIINVSCDDGTTFAFVIDVTPSMEDKIKEVKKQASAILDVVIKDKSNQLKNFVLVTIDHSDAVLRLKTNSSSTFQESLNRITISNNNTENTDCEEMSLTGIERALLASEPASYIYVFTDASAKDYNKVDTIKGLCQEKQIQVMFIMTGDCGSPSDRKHMVYYDIASGCSRQVYRVDMDQHETIQHAIP